MKCKCRLCGHEWESRKEKPRMCPRCKRYDWKEKITLEDKNELDEKRESNKTA